MKLSFITALFLVGSCTTLRYTERIENIKNNIVFEQPEIIKSHLNTIKVIDLKMIVSELASEKYEGRRAGQKGHQMTCDYLKNYYKEQGIAPPENAPDYAQIVPSTYLPSEYGDSENVIAYIKGKEFPDEHVIIMAHSDHEGIIDGKIYFGADDNASGTAAVLEIAQAFQIAALNGYKPKRSIVFLHVTAEEIGLQGSRYYTENPIFPLEKTMAVLNIDMIGRTDFKHEEDDQYLYLIGVNRHSTELPFIAEKANEFSTKLDLDYRYNDENESNRYYYRSDHYNFALKDIPVIFFFNGEHADYHKPTDTEDKINYQLLEKRTQYIFTTAWYLANMNHYLEADLIR